MNNEVQETLQMAELKRQIKLKEENIERQTEWLEQNNLDLDVLQEDAE